MYQCEEHFPVPVLSLEVVFLLHEFALFYKISTLCLFLTLELQVTAVPFLEELSQVRVPPAVIILCD